MTSSDAGATSSSINSPTVPLPMPTLSPVPSLTRSPASTTSGNLIHRPFLHGLLRSPEPFQRVEVTDHNAAFAQFEQTCTLPDTQLLVDVFAGSANDAA